MLQSLNHHRLLKCEFELQKTTHFLFTNSALIVQKVSAHFKFNRTLNRNISQPEENWATCDFVDSENRNELNSTTSWNSSIIIKTEILSPSWRRTIFTCKSTSFAPTILLKVSLSYRRYNLRVYIETQFFLTAWGITPNKR